MPKVTGKSLPVSTRWTPGCARARETSIDSMVACGMGDRSSLQCTMRGSITSSAKRVRPVTLARPSTRRRGLPITSKRFFVVIFSSSFKGTSSRGQRRISYATGVPTEIPRFARDDNVGASFLGSHPSRAFFDRLVDLLIPRAAAQVSRDRLLDPLAARIRIFLEQGLRRHEDPGRAIAALRAAQIGERGLQRVELRAGGEPLHGLDRTAFAIEREREAGKHRHAVDHHRAGAALAELATVLGSGEIHVLAQDFEKGLIRREGNLLGLAVDLQREMDVLRCRRAHLPFLAGKTGTSPRTR